MSLKSSSVSVEVYACNAFLWAFLKTAASACFPFNSLHILWSRWHSSWRTRASLKCARPGKRSICLNPSMPVWSQFYLTVFFRLHLWDFGCLWECSRFERVETEESPSLPSTCFRPPYAELRKQHGNGPALCSTPVSLALAISSWKLPKLKRYFTQRTHLSTCMGRNRGRTHAKSTRGHGRNIPPILPPLEPGLNRCRWSDFLRIEVAAFPAGILVLGPILRSVFLLPF